MEVAAGGGFERRRRHPRRLPWPGLGWLGLLLDFGFGAEESKLGGKRPCEGGKAENAEVFASWGVRGERV